MRTGLARLWQQQHHVGGARERAVGNRGHGDQADAEAARIVGQVLEFDGLAGPRQRHDHIIGRDHAEIAVARLARMHEEGGRAGRREGRRDLSADMAGFAHAGHDHAAARAAHQLDRRSERLAQSVADRRDQGRDATGLGFQRANRRCQEFAIVRGAGAELASIGPWRTGVLPGFDTSGNSTDCTKHERRSSEPPVNHIRFNSINQRCGRAASAGRFVAVPFDRPSVLILHMILDAHRGLKSCGRRDRRPGFLVARVRQPSLPLCAGTLFAAIMIATLHAVAQTVDPSDLLFMRPDTDVDPLNPLNPRNLQSTRRRTPLEDTVSPALGQIPKYGYTPASGAGLTGFDSTNRGLNANAKAKAATLTPKQKAAAAAKAKAKAKADARAAIAPPPPPNSAATRLPQYQLRRGVTTDIVDPTIIDPSLLLTPPVRRRPPPEEDPFAPTGIQVGAFNLRPAIEVGAGYDTNPGRNTVAKPGWYEAVAPELLVNSNWARHELTATLRGSYLWYQPESNLNRPSLDARVNGALTFPETPMSISKAAI